MLLPRLTSVRCNLRPELTASAGIANNHMLAKIATDVNKPNGQHCVPATRESVLNFIRELPVRKVSGIGKVTERTLQALGIHTCADIFDNIHKLVHVHTPIQAEFLLRVSMGISSEEDQPWHVEEPDPTVVHRKSIGHERTFQGVIAWRCLSRLSSRLTERRLTFTYLLRFFSPYCCSHLASWSSAGEAPVFVRPGCEGHAGKRAVGENRGAEAEVARV